MVLREVFQPAVAEFVGQKDKLSGQDVAREFILFLRERGIEVPSDTTEFMQKNPKISYSRGDIFDAFGRSKFYPPNTPTSDAVVEAVQPFIIPGPKNRMSVSPMGLIVGVMVMKSREEERQGRETQYRKSRLDRVSRFLQGTDNRGDSVIIEGQGEDANILVHRIDEEVLSGLHGNELRVMKILIGTSSEAQVSRPTLVEAIRNSDDIDLEQVSNRLKAVMSRLKKPLAVAHLRIVNSVSKSELKKGIEARYYLERENPLDQQEMDIENGMVSNRVIFDAAVPDDIAVVVQQEESMVNSMRMRPDSQGENYQFRESRVQAVRVFTDYETLSFLELLKYLNREHVLQHYGVIISHESRIKIQRQINILSDRLRKMEEDLDWKIEVPSVVAKLYKLAELNRQERVAYIKNHPYHIRECLGVIENISSEDLNSVLDEARELFSH